MPNLHFADVAVFEIHRWLASESNTRRRAREDKVTWFECNYLRNVGDQEFRVEDQFARVRILHRLTIDAHFDRQRVGVKLVAGYEYRAGRRERVERLAGQPLSARFLELPVAS